MGAQTGVPTGETRPSSEICRAPDVEGRRGPEGLRRGGKSGAPPRPAHPPPLNYSRTRRPAAHGHACLGSAPRATRRGATQPQGPEVASRRATLPATSRAARGSGPGPDSTPVRDRRGGLGPSLGSSRRRVGVAGLALATLPRDLPAAGGMPVGGPQPLASDPKALHSQGVGYSKPPGPSSSTPPPPTVQDPRPTVALSWRSEPQQGSPALITSSLRKVRLSPSLLLAPR